MNEKTDEMRGAVFASVTEKRWRELKFAGGDLKANEKYLAAKRQLARVIKASGSPIMSC